MTLCIAAFIKSGSAFGLSDLGFIIFFQVREVSPAERDLMEALLSQGLVPWVKETVIVWPLT